MVFSAQFSRSIRQSSRKGRKVSHGFSLIEILIVVGIMALLVTLIGPNLIRQFQGSQGKTAGVQIQMLKSALDLYVMDIGRYPTSAEGLDALVSNAASAPGWKGPYLRDGKLPLDPWGNAYAYGLEDGRVVITSMGADGRIGGDGNDADIKG
jgi:general secretion pathway protein G